MTRRRIPMKVAASPAAQRPENKAVESLVQSSRDHQARMRDAASNHADKEVPKGSVKTDVQNTRIEPTVKVQSKSPETKDAPPEQSPESALKTKRAVTRRVTLYVPINAFMDSQIAKIASSISKSTDYVIAAYLKKCHEALRQKFRDGKLAELAENANLLIAQTADRGTRSTRYYTTIDIALIREAQKLFDDPLELLSDTKIISAVVAAELLMHLTKE